MKKFIALLLVLTFALFMVGCDEEYTEDNATTADEYVEDDVATETDDEGMSISDYIDENHTAMVAQHGDLEAERMTLEIFEDDNSLIYQFKFMDSLPDVDTTRGLIDETIDTNSAVYQAIFENLAGYVPDAGSLIVEYLTVDDELITYKEFTA